MNPASDEPPLLPTILIILNYSYRNYSKMAKRSWEECRRELTGSLREARSLGQSRQASTILEEGQGVVRVEQTRSSSRYIIVSIS